MMMAGRGSLHPGIAPVILWMAVGVVALTPGESTLARHAAAQGRLVAYQPLPDWQSWDT